MTQTLERKALPREVQKWIHSLDLSYKITHPQKDLANGFLVGEILSRYYPDLIDMRSLNTGLSLKNRVSNWEYIKSICYHKNPKFSNEFKNNNTYKTIKDKKESTNEYSSLENSKMSDFYEIPNRILNKIPNEAFNLIIRLYLNLNDKNKDNLYILKEIEEKDKFKRHDLNLECYMRPTASKLITDKEIYLIKDEKKRKKLVTDLIKEHKLYIESNREEFRKHDFDRIKLKSKYSLFNNYNSNLYDNANTQLFKRDNNDNYSMNHNVSNNIQGRISNRIVNDDNISSKNMIDNKNIDKKEELNNLMYVVNKDYQDSNLMKDKFYYSNMDLKGVFNSNLMIKQLTKQQEENNIFWESTYISSAPDYGVENKFGEIIKKNFIETDHNIELQFKQYSDDKDVKGKDKNKDFVGFFFNRFGLALVKDNDNNVSSYNYNSNNINNNNNENKSINNINDINAIEYKYDNSNNANSFNNLNSSNSTKYINNFNSKHYNTLKHYEDNYPKLKRIFDVFKPKEIQLNHDMTNNQDYNISDLESSEVNKFKDRISKNLIELQPFIEIFTTFLNLLFQNNISIDIILKAMIRICSYVRDKDISRCETIFINYAFNSLMKVMSENPCFRNAYLWITSSLISNDKYSHLKVLSIIKAKFLMYDEVNYYHIISYWINFISHDQFDDEVKDFYILESKKALFRNCDIIKCKALLIINNLMNFYDFPIIFIEEIYKLKKSENWELLSLIVIFCTKILYNLNYRRNNVSFVKNNYNNKSLFNKELDSIMEKNDNTSIDNLNNISNDINKMKKHSSYYNQSEVGKSINLSRISEKNDHGGNSNYIADHLENNNVNINNNDDEYRNNNNNFKYNSNNLNKSKDKLVKREKKITFSNNNPNNISDNLNNNNDNTSYDKVDNHTQLINNNNNNIVNNSNLNSVIIDYDLNNIEDAGKYESKLLDIIKDIFNLSSPNLTLKICFIYLSDIIHFYPQLAEIYMDLLINFRYAKVRLQVLSVNNSKIQAEYTSHLYTEKYYSSGAPLRWDQITIAKVFADYIKNKNNSKELNTIHIQIFHAIVIDKDFDENDADEWLSFYSDMQLHLYHSLCDPKYSKAAAQIAIKFYDFEAIRIQVLQSSKEYLIKSMKHIYNRKSLSSNEIIEEECKTNMLTLLHNISTKSNGQSYIYNLIKEFGISDYNLYINSNLIELMNDIYKAERGDIFNKQVEQINQ